MVQGATMSNLTSWLQAVRERLAKATSRPWECAANYDHSPNTLVIQVNPEKWPRVICYSRNIDAPNNLTFIAHAPTDLTYAVSVIEAAQACIQAMELTVIHFERNQAGDNFQGDDEHEAWTALANALTTWHRVVREARDG